MEQNPNYIKFMHEVLYRNKRLGEFKTVTLTEGCSAMATSRLPPKLKEPGILTIPYSIGDQFVGKALYLFCVSINLMTLSIFRKFGSGDGRPTTIMLWLAKRSTVDPSGITKNMLVRVDKFIFQLTLLYSTAKLKKFNIFGKSFLSTGQELIDVEKEELTMRLNDEYITFNVLKNVSYMDDIVKCNSIDAFDVSVHEHLDENYNIKIVKSNVIIIEEIEENEEGNVMQHFELLDLHDQLIQAPKTFIEEPPKHELKPLPNHLRYVFLRENDTFTVIIVANVYSISR
ncbi:uncharacterized protein LOC120165391 [Hibiscus syriacus]|uniref:uncharacterized protein LOC120165391 n=1 Tax=Hibiscus syriacus TaxID=106335 RepID=UPI0019218FAC|nr:uncharacterized protein LOC120165391 [Hibiscus syriacus]